MSSDVTQSCSQPDPSLDHAIRVRNLSKCYEIFKSPGDRLLRIISNNRTSEPRDFWALQDVSFEVKRGDTVGIIGRNGCGKSTLLQMICGTLSPTTGSVETRGRISALLELGSGFNPEFTGRENVLLNGTIVGIPPESMADRLQKIVEFSGLSEYLDRPMKTYSSGMYARLAFSAAIHVDPDILVVDEALSVGDAGFQLKCALRMRQLQSEGVTILFVSHDMGAIARLCDSAMVIERGRLVSQSRDPMACIKLYDRLTRQVEVPLEVTAMPKERAIRSYEHELQGMAETRFGSQEARFISVEFVDANGVERQTFRAGEELQIRATVQADRPFSHIATGATLKTRSGVDIWGDNSAFAGLQPELKAGQSVISYRFTLSIPAGEYFLYIGLADVSGGRLELDQRWPVRRLTVVSNRNMVGLVYSPAEITIEHLP